MTNGDNPATRERLAHALRRLQSEPRSTDRRSEDRRQHQLAPWKGFVERRLINDRRLAERRTIVG
ncbi:MAG: hypothetical protein JO199_11855 [Candidatus Eremiobacteraeota bacterium]|nr:hypothetical protein [Candidatus Eremiobacteraeota bacterium]